MALDLMRGPTVRFDEARDVESIPADDEILAHDIARTLNRHYPGHRFGVNVDCRTGLCTIAHETDILEGNNMAYVLKLDTLKSDPMRHSAMIAGGEILERKGISRGAFKRD